MEQARIGVSLEEEEAVRSLTKLAESFDEVGDEIDDVNRKAKRAGNTIDKAFDENTKSIKKTESATKDMDSSLAKFGGAFLTMELAKKVGEFASATLEAAAASDHITGKTKETALAFVKAKSEVKAIGEGMVLVGANIASSVLGQLGFNNLLEDTAASWRMLAGLQQESIDNMNEANGLALQLADLAVLNKQYQTLNAEVERYAGKNEEFANTARQGLKEVSSQMDVVNSGLEKYGKKLDEATLKALKAGETTTVAIRSGEWDKQRKKEEDLSNSRKSQHEQFINQLKVLAESVKANYGTIEDVANRTYEAEVAKANETLQRKFITLDQYNDYLSKALLKRNQIIAGADIEASKEGQSLLGTGGDAAKQASDEAMKRAQVANDFRANELAKEAEFQSTLLALRETSASTEAEKDQVKIDKVNAKYDALADKYKDNAQMMSEIDRARSAEMLQISKETQDAQLQSTMATMQSFLTVSDALAKKNKAFAVVSQNISATMAMINSFEAMTKAFAQGGIFGIASGLALFATGASAAYSIKSQKFNDGGIVEGNSITGDRVPAMLNSDEVVWNKAQQRRMMAIANGQITGDSSNSAPNMTFNIEAGVQAVDLRKVLNENAGEFARQVKKAMGTKAFTSGGYA